MSAATEVFRLIELAAIRSDAAAMQQLQLLSSADQRSEARGFVSALVSIISSDPAAVHADMRVMAAIVLKNVVKNMWQPASAKTKASVADDEKHVVRTFLLAHLHEENNRVSAQVAQTAAMVSRNDWPALWPDVMTVLFAEVQRCNTAALGLRRLRAMGMLHEVLQGLQSKRIRDVRIQLLKTVVSIFPSLLAMWTTTCGELQSTMMQQSAAMMTEDDGCIQIVQLLAMQAFMSTKLITIILKENYVDVYTLPELAMFFPAIFGFSQFMASFLKSFPGNILGGHENTMDDADDVEFSGGGIVECPSDLLGLQRVVFISRALLFTTMRIPCDLVNDFPLEFSPYLDSGLSFAGTEMANVPTAPFPGSERFYQCICRFLSAVTHCGVYTDDEEKFRQNSGSLNIASIGRKISGLGERNVSELHQFAVNGKVLRDRFFSTDRVSSLVQTLLGRMLRLSQSDLQHWVEDGEEYLAEQEATNASSSLRVAAEDFFLNLIEEYQETVSAVLVAFLQNDELKHFISSCVSTVAPVPSSSSTGQFILLLDAMFLAAGVGNSVLSQFIDSAMWMQGSVAPLTNALFSSEFAGAVSLSDDSDDGVAYVLRRRLLWLLSCWSYHISPDMLPGIVQLLTAVLSQAGNGGDIVTMLQAIDTLNAITQTESFRSSMLVDKFPTLVESMCLLTTRLEESEHQAKVVDLIAELVLLMGTRVRPVLHPITSHLCTLWSASGPGAPVKSSILFTLSRIVRSAGMASDSFHPVLLPLVASVFSDSESAFLVPDACALWQGIARDSVAYSPSLDTLLKIAIPILIQNEDFCVPESSVRKSLMIILESYAIIGGQAYLVSCADSLNVLFSFILDDLEPKMAEVVMRPIEALYFTAPAAVTDFLVASDLLRKILHVILGNMTSTGFPAYFHIADNFKRDIVPVTFLSTVCRALMTNSAAVTSLLTSILNSVGINNSDAVVVQGLVRYMVDKFDSASYRAGGLWHQRLWLLTLVAFFPSQDPSLISCLPDIVNYAMGTLAEDTSDSWERMFSTAEGHDPEGEEPMFRTTDDIDATAAPGPESVVALFGALMKTDLVSNADISAVLNGLLEGMRPFLSAQDMETLIQQTRI